MDDGSQRLRHLLLVEDNDVNREMLRRRLERRGYVVSMAADGDEAIRQASATSPEIILMDLGLPNLDGWEATRRLKEVDATAGIPVIALTGHVMEADRLRALQAGCDAFETKPVDLDRLIARIDALLDA